MSTGYTKLFSDIITSTIWQEPNDCRVLWITMLALKDEANICRATVPALSKLCNISLEQCESYLDQFQQPDKYSRSQDFEGRRIEPVDGGFLILNGQKYRDMLRGQERRDYVRERVAEHRLRVASGKQRNQSVIKCNQSNQCKPIAEAEEQEEEQERQKSAIAPAVVPPKPKETDEEWLSGLSSDPTYQGINVQIEFGKMRNWCEQHRKKPSRARFINWINRIERPMQGQEAGPYGHLKILG